MNFYCVIMAGGSGTRFWPLSTKKHPKQFLNIGWEKSLLEMTAERAFMLTNPERTIISTVKKYVDKIHSTLPEIPVQNILLEPIGRNTAPCIGLAALTISQINPDGIMVILPADHFIGDSQRFIWTLKAACSAASEDHLVTIGIKPSKPETGYGYIQRGQLNSQKGGFGVFEVKRFVEKPNLEKAKEYLASGEYFWNAGIFAFKAKKILKEISIHLPDLYDGLMKINESLGSPLEEKVTKEVFESLEGVSIDYGIMEKAENIKMLQGDFDWTDLGSWAAIPEVLESDENGNCILGKSKLMNSKNCVVYSPDKLVTIMGMDDIIVVNAPNAILVCPKSKAQDIKKIVNELKDEDGEEYL